MKDVELMEVMRRWASSIAILTTGNLNHRHGMTVNSFTSISVDPPLVTVTANNSTRTRQLMDEVGYFAINLLSEGQEEISDLFAGRVPEQEDRFQNLVTHTSDLGLPLLSEAAGWVECKIVHRYEMPTSTLFVGEVLHSAKSENLPPLLYMDRKYHRICL